MAKTNGLNSKFRLIEGAYITAFGLCSPGDQMRDRTPPDRQHVAICKRWLRRNAAPRKTMNRFSSSYGLKHEVERTAGPGVFYVTNGSLIAAAVKLGYRCKRIGHTPNAVFNMRLSAESSVTWHSTS